MALKSLTKNLIEDQGTPETLPGRSRLKRNEKTNAKNVKQPKMTPLMEAIMVKPASVNPKPVGGSGKPGVPYGENPPIGNKQVAAIAEKSKAKFPFKK